MPEGAEVEHHSTHSLYLTPLQRSVEGSGQGQKGSSESVLSVGQFFGGWGNKNNKVNAV